MCKMTRAEATEAFANWCRSNDVGGNKPLPKASKEGGGDDDGSKFVVGGVLPPSRRSPKPPDNFDSWVEYHTYFNAWTLRKLVLYYLAVAWWSTLLCVHTLTGRTIGWPELVILAVVIPPRLQYAALTLTVLLRCLGGPQPFLPWLVDLIRAS